MAIRGCRGKLFIDELVLSSFTGSFTVNNTVDVITYTVLQNCNNLKLPSIPNGMIDITGYMNDNASDSLEEKIREALSSQDTYIAVMVEDPDNSKYPGLIFDNSFVSSSNIETPLDNLIALSATWEKVNERTDGQFIANEVTSSAMAPLSGIDFGAQGTSGGKAFLLVHSISGSATDATIDVESDDNSNFTSATSEGTFTFSATGVYELVLSGTIDRYIRANVTDLGGATNFNYSIIVGINGVTQ